MSTINDILSAMATSSNTVLGQTLSEATRTNDLSELGKMVISDKSMLDEFTNLLLKVGQTIIHSKMYNNPLSALKSGKLITGAMAEDIFVSPPTEIPMNSDGTILLKTYTPDTKVAYYSINRQSSWCSSFSEDRLSNAFASLDNLGVFIREIFGQLYNADYIAEFNMTKKLFADTIDSAKSTIVSTDIASPKDVLKSIAMYSGNFKYPSTDCIPYNKELDELGDESTKRIINFADLNDQVLIIPSSIKTEIDFEYIASIFNKSVADINAMTVEVDYIPSAKYDVYAILADKGCIQIKDKINKVTSFYNASNNYTNIYLHHSQIMYISTFGKMVAFGKAKG